ncbi:hypothetical protein [Kribbella speibonae]|uniref:Uncharacterized protein n=1 Tax=Kribbella speibonae TaxID=1572660 RepID=A0A4R0ISS7_9ACTN|nr:hypothetical protein [Kribbella speibonae]TCC19590.1 hypothetical protein E0H58_32380 [Kribbella speibonae]TCC31755.1 hypothetical protein E0H92_35040 [Kribbella speibonae]
MPDPTDEELGTLLRETFAAREALIPRAVLDDRSVQAATKPGRAMPALLAAAVVLVVLTGALYGVQRLRPADAGEPAAGVSAAVTPTASSAYTTRDADVWGLAIGTMLRSFQLPGKKPRGFSPFTKAMVVDSPSTAPGRVRPGPQFSPNQRVVMFSHTLRIMPVTILSRSLPENASCTTYPKTAIIRLSDVLDKGDHLEVDVALSMPAGCSGATSARYRVEPRDAHWVITQNLGPWNR